VHNKFLTFKPRQLEIPRLTFGNSKEGGKIRTGKRTRAGGNPKIKDHLESYKTPATWNLSDVFKSKGGGGFHEPQELGSLAIIRVGLKADNEEVAWLEVDFKNEFAPVLEDYGFKDVKCIGNFAVQQAVLPDGKSKTSRADLASNLTRALKKFKEFPQPAIVQLRRKEKTIYANIKWWGDCVQGITTICSIRDKMRKPNRNYLGNLASVLIFTY
jgi:hypothetical protein